MAEGSQEIPNPTSPTTDGQATQRDPIDAKSTWVLQSLLQSVTSLQPGGGLTSVFYRQCWHSTRNPRWHKHGNFSKRGLG